MTKGQQAAADVVALLRARNPLLWIISREEARVEACLAEAAKAVRYEMRTWDVAAGVRDLEGRPDGDPTETKDPGAVLGIITQQAFDTATDAKRRLWALRDFPAWFGGGLAGASTLRAARNLARTLPTADLDRAQAMVIISPGGDVPPELQNHATVIEWPLPDREEIAAVLDAAIDMLRDADAKAAAAPNGQRDKAIDAAVGLTEEEARACYARSLVQHKRIDVATVAGEKRRVIARERVLEYYEPLAGGLDAVGGLDNLKAWLMTRASAFTPEARAFGLPAPKGTLIVGIPGTGKSLTAKAIGTAWSCPLIRMDLGALKSKFVGESEATIRKAFKVIEAMGRCIVWLDEIEKALQGATSGSSDGGTSADQLGAILSWMQERQGEAFVVATANDVSALPPELLRKGRFDEVWFVDLPTLKERMAILAAALRSFGREVPPDVLQAVAEACPEFTGSELAALVPDALFAAFNDGKRALTADDLLKAAATVVPLSKTASDKIANLRAWAKTRARSASAIETTAERRTRTLDVA